MPDCTPVLLPKVIADFCNPSLNFGRIDKIYLGNEGEADFADWTSAAEWNARLDNATENDSTKIRTLHVIGSKPKPESTTIDYSLDRSVQTEKKHTIPVKVDETHDDNYALVKFLEDNVGQQVKLWYASEGFLYGGPSGISVNLVLDDIIPEDNKALNTFDGEATWKGKTPDRIVNPLS